jgi:hypothetical protein
MGPEHPKSPRLLSTPCLLFRFIPGWENILRSTRLTPSAVRCQIAQPQAFSGLMGKMFSIFFPVGKSSNSLIDLPPKN